MNPRLVAVVGPLEGETYPITAGELSIGRNPGSGISIPDESVSRRHCSIVGDDAGRVLIRDSDSRNGTFVNGLPIQERQKPRQFQTA